MKIEPYEGTMNPNDIDGDGDWMTPDGESVNVADVQFETPDGVKAWPVAVTSSSDMFPTCLFCEDDSKDNLVILLDNDEYIYMSKCCGQVAFCKDKGEEQ